MNSFFRELKQRKVCSIALRDAVVLRLVVQVDAKAMPAYDGSGWILPMSPGAFFQKLCEEKQP
jgi:hypothetical protein